MDMVIELNQPAPEFTLPDLDGRIHMLSDYRGQIVIVNFWSAECPHSERVDADITACFAQWGDEVALLSIASNANEPDGMINGAASRRKTPGPFKGCRPNGRGSIRSTDYAACLCDRSPGHPALPRGGR